MLTRVAVVVVGATATENQAPCAAILLVERATPAVAVETSVVERIEAPTRRRQEDGVAIGAGDFHAVHAVVGSTLPCALIFELLTLCLGGHAPTAAPIGSGGIILCPTDVATDIYVTAPIMVTIGAFYIFSAFG